jgi:hypothetical protein
MEPSIIFYWKNKAWKLSPKTFYTEEEINHWYKHNRNRIDGLRMLYILYPKKFSDKVKIINLKPTQTKHGKKYGFAEGPFRNKALVIARLNWMSIQLASRPAQYTELTS